MRVNYYQPHTMLGLKKYYQEGLIRKGFLGVNSQEFLLRNKIFLRIS
jgi:hypothetical protein